MGVSEARGIIPVKHDKNMILVVTILYVVVDYK